MVQAWDKESAIRCARAYKEKNFDGIAIGGLVPRIRNWKTVSEIVEAVRQEIPDLPLHIFGIGKPALVERLFEMGVDSVDSSSYVKMAADGKLWDIKEKFLGYDLSPTERLNLALLNLANASRSTLPLSSSKFIFGLPNNS